MSDVPTLAEILFVGCGVLVGFGIIGFVIIGLLCTKDIVGTGLRLFALVIDTTLAECIAGESFATVLLAMGLFITAFGLAAGLGVALAA